jgi:hypothetical protein
MDEKQTAALREVFEKKFVERSNALVLNEDGRYRNSYTQIYWEGFLACYQHLAPMVEDAERYRFLEFQARFGNYRGIISRAAIDAAREQEKKTC